MREEVIDCFSRLPPPHTSAATLPATLPACLSVCMCTHYVYVCGCVLTLYVCARARPHCPSWGDGTASCKRAPLQPDDWCQPNPHPSPDPGGKASCRRGQAPTGQISIGRATPQAARASSPRSRTYPGGHQGSQVCRVDELNPRPFVCWIRTGERLVQIARSPPSVIHAW